MFILYSFYIYCVLFNYYVNDHLMEDKGVCVDLFSVLKNIVY